MEIFERLRVLQLQRDGYLYKKLAAEIIATDDNESLNELSALTVHADKRIAETAAKALFEVAEQDPQMAIGHAERIFGFLSSKTNRLVWGAMIAIAKLTELYPDTVYAKLDLVLDAAENGTVITKDQAVKILVAIARKTSHSNDMQLLLIDMLKSAPENQLPSYAEQAAAIISEENKALLIRIINERLKDIFVETKRTRIEKVLRKLK